MLHQGLLQTANKTQSWPEVHHTLNSSGKQIGIGFQRDNLSEADFTLVNTVSLTLELVQQIKCGTPAAVHSEGRSLLNRLPPLGSLEWPKTDKNCTYLSRTL